MNDAAPAKKTAKKAPAKKAAAKAAAQPQQSTLYKIPEEWEYQVIITSPDGQTVVATASAVTVNGNVTSASSLPDALRKASKAAKALDSVSKKQAALDEARAEALSFLGTD